MTTDTHSPGGACGPEPLPAPGHGRYGRAVSLGASGAAVLALAGLLGYIPGLEVLSSLDQDYVPMAPSTASCFFILSLALLHHRRRPWQGRGSRAMLLLVFFVTLFSLLDLAGDVIKIDFNFEDRLTAGVGVRNGIPLGRMSPATATTFILAGFGTLSLLLRGRKYCPVRWLDSWASTLGLLTIMVGATVLLAYLYGTPLMYSGDTIPMAATTALAFVLLGIAMIAAAGPASFPLCLVSGDSTSALLSRVFLPLTGGAVILQGLLLQFASVSAAVNTALVSAFLVIVTGTVTAILVARVAHSIGGNLDELTRRLRQSEEQRQSILMTAMDGFLLLDRQGRLLEGNETYCRMSGYDLQELLTLNIGDLEALETEAEIAGHIKNIMEKGEDRFESRHRRKDGTFFEVEISVQHRLLAGEKLVVFLRDITERKQAEESLRRQQTMLARTERLARIGSWEYDAGTGKVLWSEEMYRLFNLAASAGPPSLAEHRQLFPPADFHRLQQHIDAALQRGEAYELSLHHLCAGELRHSLVWGHAERDGQGEVIRLVGSFQDLTALRKAEAERERLLTAIEQVGEIIYVTDPEGSIQYVNPAFELVTGYSREEVIGKNPRIFKSGQHDRAFYQAMYATISSGRTWQGRMVNKRKDGSLYTEEATLSPVLDPSGRIVNYVAVKRDISERLKMEAQLLMAQKMESVGRLAGGVAHDYNNMLSVIVGYSDLALEKLSLDGQLFDYINEIRNAAVRSIEITRQLLAFARKQTIAPVTLDLNETVASMLKMLRRLIGEDIDLAWLPAEGLWPVKMDPSQVDQILANLSVNARDAIAGVGRVTIETGKATFDTAYCADHGDCIPGEYVSLTVSDDGCGMDHATVATIFEPFFTTKAIGQGTGLGLATVFGIVKQNNGFINVDSEPGKGTTFTIYLARHADWVLEASRKKTGAVPLGHGQLVLVVEDEESILKLAQKLLEKLGYTVLVASVPSQALDLARQHRHELRLLITDVVMPEMNGKELSNLLHEACPGIRTLFMSGYTADVIAHRGVLEEGVHFIQKPFSKESMAVKVSEALR